MGARYSYTYLHADKSPMYIKRKKWYFIQKISAYSLHSFNMITLVFKCQKFQLSCYLLIKNDNYEAHCRSYLQLGLNRHHACFESFVLSLSPYIFFPYLLGIFSIIPKKKYSKLLINFPLSWAELQSQTAWLGLRAFDHLSLCSFCSLAFCYINLY